MNKNYLKKNNYQFLLYGFGLNIKQVYVLCTMCMMNSNYNNCVYMTEYPLFEYSVHITLWVIEKKGQSIKSKRFSMSTYISMFSYKNIICVEYSLGIYFIKYRHQYSKDDEFLLGTYIVPDIVGVCTNTFLLYKICLNIIYRLYMILLIAVKMVCTKQVYDVRIEDINSSKHSNEVIFIYLFHSSRDIKVFLYHITYTEIQIPTTDGGDIYKQKTIHENIIVY